MNIELCVQYLWKRTTKSLQPKDLTSIGGVADAFDMTLQRLLGDLKKLIPVSKTLEKNPPGCILLFQFNFFKIIYNL